MKLFLIIIITSIVGYLTFRFPVPGLRSRDALPIPETKENKFLAKALESHVYKLSHEIGDRSIYKYESLNKAADYIVSQFKSYGYDVAFQEYTVSGKLVKNIIAVKTGKQKPEKIVVVGAHYDTCFNPGADDNASAVSGVLELARLLVNVDNSYTIKFITFVNEEPPFFKTKNMGSVVYAKNAKRNKEDIVATVVFEMIGYYFDKANSQKYPWFLAPFYPNKGNFIAVVGNLRSRHLVKKTVLAFKKQTDFPIESTSIANFVFGADLSDHWSFWQSNYPAVMVTDTAFYRNPNYHSAKDTYEKLNYKSMAEVIRGFKAVLLKLAG